MTGNLVSKVTDDALIQDLQQLLTEQTRQSAATVTTEQIVEAALLEDLSIDDCAVLIRETAASEPEIVACRLRGFVEAVLARATTLALAKRTAQ